MASACCGALAWRAHALSVLLHVCAMLAKATAQQCSKERGCLRVSVDLAAVRVRDDFDPNTVPNALAADAAVQQVWRNNGWSVGHDTINTWVALNGNPHPVWNGTEVFLPLWQTVPDTAVRLRAFYGFSPDHNDPRTDPTDTPLPQAISPPNLRGAMFACLHLCAHLFSAAHCRLVDWLLVDPRVCASLNVRPQC